MGYRRFVLVMAAVVCFMLAVVACVPVGVPVSTLQLNIALTATPVSTLQLDIALTATPAASTTPTSVDPEAIAAQLTPVATLSQAAEQLARAMKTTAGVARVRVEAPPNTDTCVTCDRPPIDPAESEFEGVPVKDVPLPLVPGSAVWLTVRDVVCLYAYDGEDLRLVSVRVVSR